MRACTDGCIQADMHAFIYEALVTLGHSGSTHGQQGQVTDMNAAIPVKGTKLPSLSDRSSWP